MRKIYFLSVLLSASAMAQESPLVRDNPDLLAARGNGEVTTGDFEARVNRIPPESRFATIRSRSRFEDMLNKLLVDAQLEHDAKEAKFDQDPVVRARMELAMREELARAWIEFQVDQGDNADYAAMAREEWQLNQGKYMTPETIDVAHILIGTEERSQEEALEIASDLREQLRRNPEQFAELAKTYSDDAGSSARGGTYDGVKRGDMVAPFENAAFALEIGEISDPVLTDYGYHIVQLNGITPPEPQPYEAVRYQLENEARARHRERRRREYLQPLYAEEMEVTRQSVENAVERALGPEVLANGAVDDTSG